MTRLRPMWLMIIAGSSALAGLVTTVIMVANGFGSPVLPPASTVTLVGIGCVVLGLGTVVWWDLRRLEKDADDADRAGRGTSRDARRRRAGRRIHPLEAARVVVAGQACGYAGAVIAGWHAGVLIDLGPAAGMAAPNVNAALLMIIGGLAWVIIGFVVEQLCRLPPDRGDGEDGSGNAWGRSYRDFGEEPGTATSSLGPSVITASAEEGHAR